MRRSFRARLKENGIFGMFHHTAFDYPTPINLNYNWNLGSVALVVLIVQIITGIFLAMFYIPHVDHAFESVEYIMREVNYGFLMRFLHANGATMFFVAVYIHIVRGFWYGSYMYPRQLLWMTGVIILLLMIITAFIGYVLPWGQMSFWGATVITNLVSVVPFIGQDILWWLWGSFNVDNATLKKFFSLHFVLPFVILLLSVIHIALLHQQGSNNPEGVEIVKSVGLTFSPFYFIKDYFGLFFLGFFYLGLVLFAPDYAGHPDNYIPANPMVTPAHIVPEWYFLPFFAILRSFEDKMVGVVMMVFSILILVVIPFYNRPTLRSSTHRPGYKYIVCLFVFVVAMLGYLGGCPATEPYIAASQMCTFLYFFIFMVLLPLQITCENLHFEIEDLKKAIAEEEAIKKELEIKNSENGKN